MGKNTNQTRAKITANKKLYPGHYLLKIESGVLGKRSVPGQFVNVLVAEEGSDPFLRIPLGVHKIEKRGISLFYKVVGSATTILAEKKPGETIDILGPLGNGFDLKKTPRGSKRLNVLVAGGHGVAPLFALAETLLDKKEEVLVLIGASSRKGITLSAELKKIGCRVKTATDDGSAGKKGYVTGLVKECLDKKKRQEDLAVYACGPRPMLEKIAGIVHSKGLRAQVSVDPYMACGIGVCRGCAVMTTRGYKLACKDGPVFYSDEIVWEEGGGGSS